ncbi:hypothetical protein QBC36DRAFT_324682 [Triangularia setosa]|uniref:Uncharacterized protein n=1 Tax=Triangularia setosa TaxID=2587417 RepID=A0AAN6WAN6_9PEZI|nr:hypothetical protein QBC36DRAFT_324682 [Podospora setosa]
MGRVGQLATTTFLPSTFSTLSLARSSTLKRISYSTFQNSHSSHFSLPPLADMSLGGGIWDAYQRFDLQENVDYFTATVLCGIRREVGS